jgi:hypothetical protein
MIVLPMRRILFAVAALAAVLIYLIWWVTYAGIHYIPRYTVRPPGAAGEVQGTSVRLLSLTRAEQLGDEIGANPGWPDPGAVWIVAEFEAVRHDASQDFLCDTQLMGPQRRLWTPATAEVTRATPSCSPDDLVVGRPLRFESIFMVPVRFADQLAGVALPDNSTAARTPVVTPNLI